MRAIRFHYRPLRYMAARKASRKLPTIGVGRLGFVTLDTVEPPDLPGPDWVRLESRLSGICGSDLGVITARDSFTLEPFGAYPFTFGHEVIGTVTEAGAAVEGWKPGDRVVVNPMLACLQRALPACAACARGEYGLCRRVGEGVGAMTGFSPLTGGGWARWLVAHRSQLHAQGELPDEAAILTDPLASALKGVLMEPPVEGEVVLVIGAGTIGLLTIRALRLIGWRGKIVVSVRYDFQAEAARRAGADVTLHSKGALYEWAQALPGARLYNPTLAPAFVEGGPALVYDTVGSESTARDAVAVTREGGRIVMVGAASRVSADWTRLWYRQIRLTGVFAYGPAEWRGERRDIYDITLELMRDAHLEEMGLLTHVFELEEYRDAIAVALGKEGHRSIKVAFRPGD